MKVAGVLPDAVDLLDERSREAYVGILICVAAADGDLVREESAAIEAAMGRAMLRPNRRELMRAWLADPPDIEKLLDEMSDDAKRIVLRDSLIVAAVDGYYHEKEILAIKKIANAADVNTKKLESLMEWIEDGWRWMALGREILGVKLRGDKRLISNK